MVELNIYNDDDEIIKTFSTKRIRWGLLVKAVEIEEKTNAENVDAAESLKMISEFMLALFPSMSPDDLAKADFGDMKNVFRMVFNMTGHLEKNG